MIHPIGLAHVNLNVTDLQRSVRFYADVLGMQVAFEYPGAVAWLYATRRHGGDRRFLRLLARAGSQRTKMGESDRTSEQKERHCYERRPRDACSLAWYCERFISRCDSSRAYR